MQNEAGIFLLKHAYYLRIVLDYYTTALNFKIRSAHKFYFKTFLTTQAKGFLEENGSNLLKRIVDLLCLGLIVCCTHNQYKNSE